MHLICQQHTLAQSLNIINHALAGKQYTLPILSHVLLTTNEAGMLTLSGTNLEIGISLQLDAEILEPGTIALPAKLFSEIVQNLAEARVELCVSDEHPTKARISTEHNKNSLQGMDSADFPKIPSCDQTTCPILFEATQLKEYINQIAFAAGFDDSRPVLTGILMRFCEAELTLAASDSFRLAVRRVQREPNDDELMQSDILIPVRAMIELARALPHEGKVEMRIAPDRSQVHFHTAKLDLISRLIEGTFPPFHGLVPATYTTRAVLDRATLSAALKSAALLAEAHTLLLTIKEPESELGNGAILIDASKEDLGNGQSILDASVEGPAIQIRFGSKHLIDALASISTPTVALETTTYLKPGIIRPVGETAISQLHVIMPMNKAS
ncbi:MAG TPA: DNA polymerase III subunit beta [Ktedonobacteraceae bacterium]|nr:DNA polymerase III subunit beta [Ktedonobacteraceae bacterium]